MPSAIINIVVPAWGFDYVRVEYRTKGAHDKDRYELLSFHLTHYGKDVRQLDKNQVMSLNDHKVIEDLIIAKTQGGLKKSLEAFDWKQPKQPEKKKFNFKRTEIPE